jgi:hypothetical protein
MTSTMSRLVLTSALALGALAVIGGFTPVAGTAHAEPSVSPFAGSWSGTWTINEGEIDGTYEWTISDSGRITGTVYSITADHGGALVGHVGADGKLSFVGMAPGGSPSEDGNGFTFMGTAVIDGDGKLAASATASWHQDAPWSLVAILERN